MTLGLGMGVPLKGNSVQVLGPELVVNGGFEIDIVPWVASTPAVGSVSYIPSISQKGTLRCTQDFAGANFGCSSGSMTLEVGESYRASGTLFIGTHTSLFVRVADNSALSGLLFIPIYDATSSVSFSVSFVATDVTMYYGVIGPGISPGTFYDIDKFSIRKILRV